MFLCENARIRIKIRADIRIQIQSIWIHSTGHVMTLEKHVLGILLGS